MSNFLQSVIYNNKEYILDESLYSHDFLLGKIHIYLSDDDSIEYVISKNYWIINGERYNYKDEKFEKIITTCDMEKTNKSEFGNLPNSVRKCMKRLLKKSKFKGYIKDFDGKIESFKGKITKGRTNEN